MRAQDCPWQKDNCSQLVSQILVLDSQYKTKPGILYDDKAIAVELCSKIDFLVIINCHQCSGVGDLDL